MKLKAIQANKTYLRETDWIPNNQTTPTTDSTKNLRKCTSFFGRRGGAGLLFTRPLNYWVGGGTYFQNCAYDIKPFLIFLPGNFKNTLDYWAKKLKKCPVLYTQYKENSLFCHFLLQIEPTTERFSNVLKFYNFKNILDTRLSSTKVKIVAHKVSAI